MNEKSIRAKNIDLLKAVLVLVMVAGHAIPLLTLKPTMIQEYANLTSFSGFLFCFGYSTYVAYLTKDFKQVVKKLLKNIVRLLLVFYISGFTYELLIERNYNIVDYIKTFALLKLPGYSEFLAAFAILNLLILICFKVLKQLAESKKILLICSGISLFAAFIPYEKISFPWANLLIGTLDISFPILQYLNLFFAGMYFAKYKPKFNVKVLLVTIICSVFYMTTYKVERISGRFPPKIGFVIGSYMFLYLYYHITLYITSKFDKNKWLDKICFIRKRYTIIFTNK